LKLKPLNVPVIVEYGSLPTSDWRTLRPELNASKCKLGICVKCRLFELCIKLCKGVCVKYCPEGCMHVTPEGLAIDYDYCKGCGICANECPFGALRMTAEV